MTPERQFEDALMKELSKNGVFAHHFDANGCDGFPDIVVIGRNSCVLVECKYETTKRRADQVAFEARMRQTHSFDKIVLACRMAKKRYYAVIIGTESTVCTTVGQVASIVMRELGR